MKKFLFGLSFIFATITLSAKKVKFAVDMTGQTISTFGVHVMGDFQVAAGYASDYNPSSTSLTQEGSTNIYSIVLTIPAFAKYEYLFVNGDQTYDAEFVPEESRVGYNFDDNRWMYVDSLANDTSFVGAIVFSSNAPAGLSLVRFKVDMNNALPSSANGIHVGDINNAFSPSKVRLYSFGGEIYEIISYYTNGSYAFKYFNGNTSGTGENITGSCSVFGNRGLTVTKDTVMAEVCFNYCSSCASVDVKEMTSKTNSFEMFPNPAKNSLTVRATINNIQSVSILNVSGQQVLSFTDINAATYTISNLSLLQGIYIVKITNSNKQQQNQKLIIE